MKDLIKQYLDQGVSRRSFLSALGGLGVSAAAADAMANSLAPFVPQAPSTDGAPAFAPFSTGVADPNLYPTGLVAQDYRRSLRCS